MKVQSCGFLNLPEWHELLQKIISDFGREDLLRLPVLGSENVESPWFALDREDFYSAIQTGIHFAAKTNPPRFPENVITADASTAINRLLEGKYQQTHFSAAIGSTFAFNLIAAAEFVCPKIAKILVQNDAVTGFILTKMEKEGKTLEAATHEAQWEKIVTGSPNLNLHGVVTRDRLILQIAELFGVIIAPEFVPVYGINALAEEDVAIAGKLGFSIRLLGIAERSANTIKAIVEPCIIPNAYLLAQARSGSEMLYAKTVDGSAQVYSCPGTSPTLQVRAILNDLNCAPAKRNAHLVIQNSQHDFTDSFYVRFSLVNLTDTMAQILQLFNRVGVEILEIHQPVPLVSRETPDCDRHCLVLVTDKTTREMVEKALSLMKEQVKLASARACFRFIRKA